MAPGTVSTPISLLVRIGEQESRVIATTEIKSRIESAGAAEATIITDPNAVRKAIADLLLEAATAADE